MKFVGTVTDKSYWEIPMGNAVYALMDNKSRLSLLEWNFRNVEEYISDRPKFYADEIGKWIGGVKDDIGYKKYLRNDPISRPQKNRISLMRRGRYRRLLCR